MPINRLNIERFNDSVALIKSNPELGKVSFEAKLAWVSGTKNELRVRRFEPFLTDEPKNMGGENAAPNPVEYLISAAAGCFSIGFEWQLAGAGIALSALEVAIGGGIDTAKLFGYAEGWGGLDNIVIHVRVAAEADLPTLQALAEKARATSPVLNSLKAQAKVLVEKV